MTQIFTLCQPLFNDALQRVRAVEELLAPLKNSTKVVGNVHVSDILLGSRVPTLLCYTTTVDSENGLQVVTVDEHNNYVLLSIADLQDVEPEALFAQFITHQPARPKILASIGSACSELNGKYPAELSRLLRSLPRDLPAMNKLASALPLMGYYSDFGRAMKLGPVSQHDKLLYTLNDALRAFAWMPRLVAETILSCRGEVPDLNGVWQRHLSYAQNFRNLLGIDDPKFSEWLRLFLILHSDHEAGNGSAHTCRLISSCEGTLFMALAGMVEALSGPRHGDAAKNAKAAVAAVYDRFGGVPTPDQAREVAREIRVAKGGRFPGMGHAVLNQDIRFEIEMKFAQTNFPGDPLVQTVSVLAEHMPPVFASDDEIKAGRKPVRPNVDFGSGVITTRWIPEEEMGTVLFAAARTIGCSAQAVGERGLNLPIERMISLSIPQLLKATATA